MAASRRTSALARRRSAIIRRDRQGLTWTELVQRIEDDPCFNIHTADGKYWIDPFTGKRAAAAKVNRVAALHHYFQTYPHWQKYPIKSIQELEFWRWVHFLGEHIRNEQRLRFYKVDGEWLNPFTGTWHDEVRRVDGRITSMTLHEMAKVLAVTVEPGPAEMMSFERLRGIIEAGHRRGGALSDAPVAASPSPEAATVAAEDPGPEAEAEPPTAAEVAAEVAVANAAVAETPIKHQGPRARGPETQRAQAVQHHLLGGIPEVPGYHFAVAYHPMSSVSGDFYDIRPLDEDRIFVCIGDISGHGVQAALAMATALKSLRTITRLHDDPVEIACALNDDIKGDLMADQFLTMWFGILHTDERRLRALSCGHHPALVVNAEGEMGLRRILARGAAIGMSSSERIRSTFHVAEMILQPGDLIAQYTDGLSEAMDADQREYGDLRIQGSLLSSLEGGTDLTAVLEGVVSQVLTWSNGEQADDLTMIAMRVDDAD